MPRNEIDMSKVAEGHIQRVTGSVYKFLAEILNEDEHSWWKKLLVPVVDEKGNIIFVKKEYKSTVSRAQQGVLVAC